MNKTEMKRLFDCLFQLYFVYTICNSLLIFTILLQEEFPKVLSRKFLPVIYQLAARLGTTMTCQSVVFKETLENVCHIISLFLMYHHEILHNLHNIVNLFSFIYAFFLISDCVLSILFSFTF